MIYLIEYCIDSHFDVGESNYAQIIIESPYENCEEMYKEFVLNKAKDFGIVVNKHWFNVCDYQKFHSHMSKNEFKKISKEFKKWFKEWSLSEFIIRTCEGKLIEHKKVLQITSI